MRKPGEFIIPARLLKAPLPPPPSNAILTPEGSNLLRPQRPSVAYPANSAEVRVLSSTEPVENSDEELLAPHISIKPIFKTNQQFVLRQSKRRSPIEHSEEEDLIVNRPGRKKARPSPPRDDVDLSLSVSLPEKSRVSLNYDRTNDKNDGSSVDDLEDSEYGLAVNIRSISGSPDTEYEIPSCNYELLDLPLNKWLNFKTSNPITKPKRRSKKSSATLTTWVTPAVFNLASDNSQTP